MIRVDYLPSDELPVHGVRSMWRSRQRCFRRLVLLDRPEDSAADDWNAAASVASYDWLIPVRDGQYMLPGALERLAAEAGQERTQLVRSWMGHPFALFDRERVAAAGGFGNRPVRQVPRRHRRLLWEPLFYRPQTKSGHRKWQPWAALALGGAIAATAANKGYLTAATDLDVEYRNPKYFFDKQIYENRVFDSKGAADPDVEIHFGPNIKDWPAMSALPRHMILKVVSEIHDPVTTTDELIPSGETSSYRSNPLGLAEFTLSRKDPEYVGKAKAVQLAQKAVEAGDCPAEAVPELKPVFKAIHNICPDVDKTNVGIGSTIFAVKPGDGSAREQAASCQKVLGGWANIANSYATKRYRSNLINWGMLPFLIDEGELPFENGDYIFLPDIADAVKNRATEVKAYAVKEELKEFTLRLGEMTDDEREIILKGCLINYNRV